jgi:rubrerythrin
MTEEKQERKLIRRLNMSYLGEIGSVALYLRQSQLTRDRELAESLVAFIKDESRHAENLVAMIKESGGKPSGLGVITGHLFSLFGRVTALLGVKMVLRTDMMMERVGIDLYNTATTLLPDSDKRFRFQQVISQMIADEQKHQAWFQQKSKSAPHNATATNYRSLPK